MTMRQRQNLVRSGHLTIKALGRRPRGNRLGLALLIAGTLSLGIVLGQVWAHAQHAQRDRLALSTPNER